MVRAYLVPCRYLNGLRYSTPYRLNVIVPAAWVQLLLLNELGWIELDLQLRIVQNSDLGRLDLFVVFG